MRLKSVEEKFKIMLLQIMLAIGLSLSYIFVVSDKFSYMGFSLEIVYSKIFWGILITLFILMMSILVKDEFIYIVWNFIFSIFFLGEIIYYMFSCEGSFIQIVSVITVLLMLIVASYFPKLRPSIYRKKKSNWLTYLEIVSIILFLPFPFKYHKYIRVENLLLKNVYLTREVFRNFNDPIIGYVTAPLVRVFLPIIIIENLEDKNIKKVILFSVLLLYVYLCGALKSIFMGMISVFFFYKGSMRNKLGRFLITMIVFTYLGTFVALIFNNVFLLDAFVRRVFFIPPQMNNVYISYFSTAPTYMAHSPLGLGLYDYDFQGYKSLSRYVGEVVMLLPGLSANVGVFTEGYVAFNYPGIIIFSIIITLIISYFSILSFPEKYFGIIFVYLYYLNTAFLSTLLLTHGLFVLFLVTYLIWIYIDFDEKDQRCARE